MPAVQTTYNASIPDALEGMVANSEPEVVISRQVEAAAGIGFGKVALQGTGDQQILGVGAGRFRGITVLDPTKEGDTYARYDTAAVLVKGVIWVTVGAIVAVGDAAYYVAATGVITNSASGNVAIPNAFFDSSAASGALAKLRIG